MNNNLNTDLAFLDPSQMMEIASILDVLHGRTIKVIDRLNGDIDARKREIANRWKTAPFDPAQKRQIEAQEVRVAILDIRRNAEKELDALFREAGAAHARASAQRPFYDSPVKTLNRTTLGDAKRSEYMRQIESVGPAELAHLGQFAVSTGNRPLAAAIVSRLDTMPSGSRPFGSATIAAAMRLDEHTKGSEAIKIAEVRFQSIVIAIRTWKTGKANPLNSVSLALQVRTLDEKLLRELESDGASA